MRSVVEMGPVELGLRSMRFDRNGPGQIAPRSWRTASRVAMDFLFTVSMEAEWYETPGLIGSSQTPELISEAIEAAEALGL